MKNTFFLMLLCCCVCKLNAQPSSSVNINFKLFNSKAEPIGINTFCNEFRLLKNGYPVNFCNNLYDPKDKHYDLATRRFNLNVSTAYADVNIDFIYRTDIMSITFINSGYGATFDIDTLIFIPGKYAVSCASRIVNNHTLPNIPLLKIKRIDYGVAKAAYYNYLLDIFIKLNDLNQEYSSTQLFRNLQKSYHIKPNDLNHKTPEDLN
ncbi:MAG: hypothetical protein V4592_19615 [Bacteroidota bacterium]